MPKPAVAHLEESQRKLELLKSLKPYLIDVSLRESAIGSGLGQTLEDKLQLFSKLIKFGLRNITLGALNYAYPEILEVDDDFMMHLRDNGVDTTSCFAITSPGHLGSAQKYVPHISQTKLRDYRVPNTLHEISLSESPSTTAPEWDLFLIQVRESIQWLQQNISGDLGGKPRIIINIVDGCETFAAQPAKMILVLEFLAQQDIEGVSFQDAHGCFLPFQIAAFTAAARSLLPPPLKLLVHIHAGAGVENASVIDALLNGADGVWGAMEKNGPVIGHASLGELIANLVRARNPSMNAYQLSQLASVATNSDAPSHFLGKNRYCLPMSYFRQQADRFMDLAPEMVGTNHTHRVCPVVSDPVIIAARLGEVFELPANNFPEEVLVQMIRLMRQDLRAGRRIFYDEPTNLRYLYDRARTGEK